MEIIYFTKYTELGASSRLRSVQYFPFLESHGYKINFAPFFNNQYLLNLYNGKKSIFNLLHCYFNRFLKLITIKKYDLVIIEKELFPYLPAFAEYLLKKNGVKYIVDYDDAIFHNYDMSSNKIIRKTLSNKIDLVMKYSEYVFVGNSYLEEKAINAGAKNILVLPTVIDISRYSPKNYSTDKFILGWIGSPSTYKYIEKLLPVFKELHAKYVNFEIHIIGAKQTNETKDFIHYIKWSADTEVNELNKITVGIMPLNDTLWEKGKCSYKLIQYMACAKNIIASPVGMNNEIVIPNFNGRFSNSNEDWFNNIEYYINNLDESKRNGINGRKMVEDKFNIEVNLSKILQAFNKIVNEK